MPVGKPLPKELIQRMREGVLKGKTKYQVAKEMGLRDSIVYSHTIDLPSVKLGEPCIKGRAFDLLKQLLEVGYVHSTMENYQALQRIRRFLPMIQHTRVDYKWIYYLSDKNKNALQAMISLKKSKIISYQELKSITKVFGVDLSVDEKQKYVKLPNKHMIPIIRKKNGGFLSSLKKNQMRLDDFNGKNGFFGRNDRRDYRKNQGSENGSLLENWDSLVDFCIRKYCTAVVPKVATKEQYSEEKRKENVENH